MPAPRNLPLGKPTIYPSRYDASVLRAIERAPARRELGFSDDLPFLGEDVWRAFELTWLGAGGLPRIGMLTLRVPCESPAMVESKFLKLYLGSFAQTPFPGAGEVAATIEQDVSRCVGAPVRGTIRGGSGEADFGGLQGTVLDDLPVETSTYQADPTFLKAAGGVADCAVQTRLFRTLCPATGQPDTGAIAIAWRGRRLDHAGVLKYLVSYREQPCFHEHAVERIFADVRMAAEASELTVHGCFMRRGGIDINPFRSTRHANAPAVRLQRQ